jgi:hypothetical protein
MRLVSVALAHVHLLSKEKRYSSASTLKLNVSGNRSESGSMGSIDFPYILLPNAASNRSLSSTRSGLGVVAATLIQVVRCSQSLSPTKLSKDLGG